jgi:hypothetical protein
MDNLLLIAIALILLAVYLKMKRKEQFLSNPYAYSPAMWIDIDQTNAAVREAENISAGLQDGY